MNKQQLDSDAALTIFDNAWCDTPNCCIFRHIDGSLQRSNVVFIFFPIRNTLSTVNKSTALHTLEHLLWWNWSCWEMGCRKTIKHEMKFALGVNSNACNICFLASLKGLTAPRYNDERVYRSSRREACINCTRGTHTYSKFQAYRQTNEQFPPEHRLTGN